jgi:hypothetical protein
METTSILYIVIGLIVVIFLGTVYYMSQKKSEVVKEVVKEVTSVPQIIVKTVEACKLGYKLENTECVFVGCPSVATGSKPYYNDVVNKECKLYTDDVWNAYKADVVKNPCKIYTLNPNANSYSSVNKTNGSSCPLQDNCSTDAICLDGGCQQTRLVCGNGFTCKNGKCEFISGTQCPEGSYLVTGSKADKSDWKCETCNGLTSYDRKSCTSPWNPSTDNLPDSCKIDTYYARPLDNNRYQCTLRTNVDNVISQSKGCKVKDTLTKTSNTTVSNVANNTDCLANVPTNPCNISASCQNGGCNIVTKDNSYPSGNDCITCDSSKVQVVNLTNNGCFSCLRLTFDQTLANRCSIYSQEDLENAIPEL